MDDTTHVFIPHRYAQQKKERVPRITEAALGEVAKAVLVWRDSQLILNVKSLHAGEHVITYMKNQRQVAGTG